MCDANACVCVCDGTAPQVQSDVEVRLGAECLGALIVYVSLMFVLGLARVAVKLQDPFGSDIEDLSVRPLGCAGTNPRMHRCET